MDWRMVKVIVDLLIFCYVFMGVHILAIIGIHFDKHTDKSEWTGYDAMNILAFVSAFISTFVFCVLCLICD